jgi:hypothetical protein
MCFTVENKYTRAYVGPRSDRIDSANIFGVLKRVGKFSKHLEIEFSALSPFSAP